jgi:hypothetical protein
VCLLARIKNCHTQNARRYGFREWKGILVAPASIQTVAAQLIYIYINVTPWRIRRRSHGDYL